MLFARVTTHKSPTGLWSGVIDLDHGMTTKHRVHRRVGFLDEGAARTAAITYAARRLGRAVIMASVAVVVIAGAVASPSSARAAEPGASISIHSLADMPLRCSSVAECSAVAMQFGCSVVYPINVRAWIIGRAHLQCDAVRYRHALARHSA